MLLLAAVIITLPAGESAADSPSLKGVACDPDKVYVNEEVEFQSAVIYTIFLDGDRGIRIDTFTGTYALFDFQRTTQTGFVYLVTGTLGDMC